MIDKGVLPACTQQTLCGTPEQHILGLQTNCTGVSVCSFSHVAFAWGQQHPCNQHLASSSPCIPHQLQQQMQLIAMATHKKRQSSHLLTSDGAARNKGSYPLINQSTKKHCRSVRLSSEPVAHSNPHVPNNINSTWFIPLPCPQLHMYSITSSNKSYIWLPIHFLALQVGRG